MTDKRIQLLHCKLRTFFAIVFAFGLCVVWGDAVVAQELTPQERYLKVQDEYMKMSVEQSGIDLDILLEPLI